MTELVESLLTLDTFLNVCVFVFVGLMLRLYFKKPGSSESGGDPEA